MMGLLGDDPRKPKKMPTAGGLLRAPADASRMVAGPRGVDDTLAGFISRGVPAVGRTGAAMASRAGQAVAADPIGSVRGAVKYVAENIATPLGDLRDFASAAKGGDKVGMGLAMAGLIPGAGDAFKAGRFLPAKGDDYFRAAQDFTKAQPDMAGFVTLKNPDDIPGARGFLSSDGKVGYILQDVEGGTDIQGLFNNGGPKGSGTEAVIEAVRAGGDRLDNFDTDLSKIYDALGFKVTERYPFDADQSTLSESFAAMRPDYTMRQLDPEYAAFLRDPSRSPADIAQLASKARKEGKDILGRPLETPTGTKGAPAASQAQPAGRTVDGLFVGDLNPRDIRHVDATIENPRRVKGLLEVPISALGATPGKIGYAAKDDIERVRNLAEAIRESQTIDPIVVIRDSKGFYVHEGNHRVEALNLLGKKNIPAVVYDDLDDLPGLLD